VIVGGNFGVGLDRGRLYLSNDGINALQGYGRGKRDALRAILTAAAVMAVTTVCLANGILRGWHGPRHPLVTGVAGHPMTRRLGYWRSFVVLGKLRTMAGDGLGRNGRERRSDRAEQQHREHQPGNCALHECGSWAMPKTSFTNKPQRPCGRLLQPA